MPPAKPDTSSQLKSSEKKFQSLKAPDDDITASALEKVWELSFPTTTPLI